MATKAQQFRSELERSGPKQKPRPTRRTRPRPGSHNEARRVERHAAFALEETADGRPRSRKSTRRSSNRQKAASNLKLRQTARAHSPKARHPSGT